MKMITRFNTPEEEEAYHRAATLKAVEEMKRDLVAFYLKLDHALKWRMQYDCEEAATIKRAYEAIGEALEDLGEDLNPEDREDLEMLGESKHRSPLS